MKLIGKTLKGKNKIHEHGDQWRIIDTKNKVLFTDEPGPWLLLEPITAPTHCPEHKCNILNDGSRWVHATNDKDFKVEQ